MVISLSVNAAVALIVLLFFLILRRAFTEGRTRALENWSRSQGPSTSDARPRLVGVGGWLLFACLGLMVFSPLITLGVSIGTVTEWPAQYVTDQYPGIVFALWLDIAVRTVMAAIAAYVGFRLWSVLPDAVRLTKTFLILQVIVWVGLDIAAILISGLPADARSAMFLASIKGVGGSFVASLLWITYFNKSERVLLTYDE